MKKITFILVIASFLVLSCSNANKDDSKVVVKVGKSTLTTNDIKMHFPQDSPVDITNVQLERLINSWIDKEIIYQKALKTDYADDPFVKKRIRELARDFMVAYFVEQIVDKKINISKDAINIYYEDHKSEFIRKDDYYNLQIVLQESYRDARIIRDKVRSGESMSSLAFEISMHDTKEDSGKIGWISSNELPQEFQNHVPRLTVGRASDPIKTDSGYFVVLVLEKREKGQEQTLDEVQDLVTWRVKSWTRDIQYKKLVNQLKDEIEYSVDWDALEEVLIDTSVN